MTDSYRDDDTQTDVPTIRTDDTGSTARLGQLVRDVTGSIPRTHSRSFERTRTHHVVSSRPTGRRFDDTTDDWAPVDHWLEPEPNHRRTGVDPALLRIGAVAAVGVLMIPIALAVREDDGELRADEATAAATTVPPLVLAAPATTVVTIPPVAAPVQAAPAPVVDAAAAANAAAPRAQPDEPACAGIYTVISNDFWNRFPKTSGASVEEWLAANGATPDTPLYVGDELCIPAGATAPDPPPVTTAAPTTAVPASTAVPAPAPVVTEPPAPPSPAPVVTQPPAPPPPPVVTTPPAPIPAGATSTDSLCGAMPTSNGNPASTPGPATVEAMIREIWPDDLEVRALCIAKREARLRADLNNYCCYGVFAIYFDVNRTWLADLGVTSANQLYDARTNIAAAYHLYTLSGWRPWGQTDPGSG